MRCPLSSERAASEELAAAVRWYEAQRQGLGAEFLDAVLETLNKVAERPRAGTALPGEMNIRRMLVDRFPYQVVYRFDAERVRVIAVAHLRRRPGFWKRRGRDGSG